MTIKEQLHELIEELDEASAQEALDYLRWIIEAETETLADGELARVREGEAQIERGDYATLDDVRRQLGL